MRELLILAAGGKAEVGEGDRGRLLALSRAMPYENLLRALSLGIDAEALARRSEDAPLVMQMFLLRLCELPRLRKLEETLRSASPATPTRGPRREGLPAEASAKSGPRILGLVPVEPGPPPEREGRLSSGSGEREGLARFHEILDSRRRLTAAQASLAESIALDGEDLVLRFPIDKAAAKEALEEPATKKLLAEVAREAFGRPLKVSLKTGPPADGDLGQAAREVPQATLARERAATRAETDPVVRTALELFRGELTEVKEED